MEQEQDTLKKTISTVRFDDFKDLTTTSDIYDTFNVKEKKEFLESVRYLMQRKIMGLKQVNVEIYDDARIFCLRQRGFKMDSHLKCNRCITKEKLGQNQKEQSSWFGGAGEMISSGCGGDTCYHGCGHICIVYLTNDK